MSTGVDILDEARGTYLNDPNAGTYTDAQLLPQLKTAMGLLMTALQEEGVETVSEEATKVINTNDTEYSPLPPDMVYPVKMEERQPNTSDEFQPMYFYRSLPKVTAGPYLKYWSYRVERLFFVGATSDREVKLYYIRAFPILGTVDGHILGKAEQFLAAKVAALAHLFIQQNTTLAQVANDIAEAELASVLNMSTRLNQTQPSRRKPYVPFRVR